MKVKLKNNCILDVAGIFTGLRELSETLGGPCDDPGRPGILKDHGESAPERSSASDQQSVDTRTAVFRRWSQVKPKLPSIRMIVVVIGWNAYPVHVRAPSNVSPLA